MRRTAMPPNEAGPVVSGKGVLLAGKGSIRESVLAGRECY